MSELVVQKVTVQQINANNSTGGAGQVLLSDGTNTYWANNFIPPAGVNGAVQFNDGGVPNGDSDFTFDPLTNTLSSINMGVSNKLTVNAVSANGSVGSAGQVLKSDGTKTYWGVDTAAPAGADTQIQFNNGGVFGSDAEFYYDAANNIVHLVNMVATGVITSKVISANGSVGGAGQVLASDGTNTYWTTPLYANSTITFSKPITFSNTVTIGELSANGSFGAAGDILKSDGSNVYWGPPSFDNYIASGVFAANNTVATVSLVNANTSIANVSINITQSITNLSDVDTLSSPPTAGSSLLGWDGTNWVPVVSLDASSGLPNDF